MYNQLHCKKEIVILTKELLFEFQMRVTKCVFHILEALLDQRMEHISDALLGNVSSKHSLTKECWSTLAIHYLAPCLCLFEALPDQRMGSTLAMYYLAPC